MKNIFEIIVDFFSLIKELLIKWFEKKFIPKF